MTNFILVLCCLVAVSVPRILAQNCGLNEYGSNCECSPGFVRIEPGVCCPPFENYNSTTMLCECLPTLFRDPMTQVCTCPPNQAIIDPALGCQCDIGFFADANGNCCPENEQFSAGQCQCISPLIRDSSSGGCICAEPNKEYYNGICDCIPGYTLLQTGLCCGPNEQDVNGTCQCLPGFFVDPLSDICSCPQTEEVGKNGTCVCIPEYYRSGGICCHGSERNINGVCDCLPGLIRNNISLQCICPINEVFDGSSCICIRSFVRDAVTGLCCGPNEIGDGFGNCVCRPSFIRGLITNKCLCPKFEKIENGVCICNTGFVRNATGSCVCPPGEVLDIDACICNATIGLIRDPVSRQCVCPTHEILIDGLCQCSIGFKRNSNTGACEAVNGSQELVPSSDCKEYQITINCTALIPFREGNLTDSLHNFFARIFNIVEQGIGNINIIVVDFYNQILNVIGDDSPLLKSKITSFIAGVLLSCPYSQAILSSCSINNITLVSDQEIYTQSDMFGMELMAFPCP